ncbi:sulfite exporter TauE/SafE family protein [Fictibacillus phosphorivorans]|uniref:sulfite exporter TauE/SafE family protein n=1 Tax=Fictibacillus phosphorivorans TaxID=1221500 RepID=UPI00203F8C3E|nr:sulfite exporter TauE/SafE family protein [Fictibacillus phosphorivorans]MCM3718850.1 sulfite exporter TauE/SafE family protein [Fictibacillus phosphorivorans]MCM3776472.1 sulfite exporter TauE/SafE family protein [Fictibacillus phosphorivorans]
MEKLIILAFIGLLAQLIDGSLGMAYGVTSTSLLLVAGIAPAAASASVHLAEVVTTAASGISHIRFGNVDKRVVLRLIIPGSVGAFLGACFLSSLPGDIVKPYVSLFLIGLGFYILFRFLSKIGNANPKPTPAVHSLSKKQLMPLGLLAGFLDATGGGGWGPVTTPVLLAKDMKARKVIGSVDTSEFAVAVSASVGFFISLGWAQVEWLWVGALMAGGIVAAPIAAWLVRIIPSHILGVLVGGLIIITNVRTLLLPFGFSSNLMFAIYFVLAAFWAVGIIYTVKSVPNAKKNKNPNFFKNSVDY